MSEPVPYEIAPLSVSQARLFNAINAAMGTGAAFKFSPLSVYDSEEVVSAFLNINGAILKVSALSDDFLNEDPLLKDINPRSLPFELLSASLEMVFNREIEYLSSKVNAYITFCDPPVSFTSVFELYCTLNHETCSIPLKIEIPNDEAAFNLAHMFENLEKNVNEGLVHNLGVELGFDIGYVTLKTRDLKNLACGDILIPDVYLFDSNLAYAKIGNKCLVFELAEGQGIFKGIKTVANEENINNMSDNTQDMSMNEGASQIDETGTVNTDDLNFDVAFEVDRRSLTYDEVSTLKPGSVLTLSCSKQSPVSIKVNGKIVGSGRLVDLGDSIGVQVTELKS
ncbi:type III secretion system apparatus protein YscQ/HrcQ [Succinivibrio dextrinosolvens]|uniref:type III secretion system cytoplasmic ring protein SctQ n=1 Tax=Succinivibrio dextrinosolvens TaxID=83771 RepID=UPI0008EC1B13|nr:type III secretion system cytoplasmic ring protein SctQ [Succinivibrio dextrinosolvens]SFS80670.1 type III secretion system apparatus protein YscQ/HrcQ [Succinivibrio dextrinosolvens]